MLQSFHIFNELYFLEIEQHFSYIKNVNAIQCQQ